MRQGSKRHAERRRHCALIITLLCGLYRRILSTPGSIVCLYFASRSDHYASNGRHAADLSRRPSLILPARDAFLVRRNDDVDDDDGRVKAARLQMASPSSPPATAYSRCPPRSEARSRRPPTRWTSRLMPFFLLGVIGYACWALTKPICSESLPSRAIGSSPDRERPVT